MSSAVQASAACTGVLLVLNDVRPGCEAEFNRWYQEQHLPERLAVPGFRTARRYQAVDASPEFMAVYECDTIEVLSSAPYRQRLANPTDWTRTMMPNFRNMVRSACRQTWTAGAGLGGTATVVRCRPDGGRQAEARRFVTESFGPDLMRAGGVAQLALWEADAAAAGGPTAEMTLRGAADGSADWVIFIESDDPDRLAPALQAAIGHAQQVDSGLLIDSGARYRLICRYQVPD